MGKQHTQVNLALHCAYLCRSIGSLGANNSWAHVSDVLVEKATLLGTTNGVRIKTWQVGNARSPRLCCCNNLIG